MQNVLQKFVDDFVDSVFNTSLHNSSHGAAAAVYANLGTVSVPPAIKFLFDFLDQEAAENGIHHPNILHVWKCNRLDLATCLAYGYQLTVTVTACSQEILKILVINTL